MKLSGPELISLLKDKTKREKISAREVSRRLVMSPRYGYYIFDNDIAGVKLRQSTKKKIIEYLNQPDREEEISSDKPLIDSFIKRYYQEKLTHQEASRRIGLSHTTIKYIIGNIETKLTFNSRKRLEDYLSKPALVHNDKEYKKDIWRVAKLGSRNPRWNNGASEYPDHALLKKHRLIILKKSCGKCEICKEHVNRVHHIDGDKSNHSIDNLMAVCIKCHTALHAEDCIQLQRQPRENFSVIMRQFGMSVNEIAKKIGIKPATARYHLKFFGKERSGKSRESSKNIDFKLNELLMNKRNHQ